MGSAKTAIGNDLDNIINGNNLDNIINGGLGNDTLNGGLGNDTLTGGLDNDTFVFSSLLDGSIDTITDFTIGEDKIALSKSIFTSLSNTMQDFNDYIIYNSETGHIAYDADGKGSGNAIDFAEISTGLTQLDQSNFNIIA